ncbi:MAG: fumarylacetoacetate hydrolase family protein [Armatimonadetes bacterium]|nr:fumarylacetoacetate hydrolase family protein [Armatimonadota bacterium]
MKLVTYKRGQQARLGVLADDRVIDLASALSRFVPDAPATSDMLSFLESGQAGMQSAQSALDACRKEATAMEEIACPLADVALKAPIGNPRKFICIGLNYRDHCEEQNLPLPKVPILFAKFPTSIIGPGEAIVHPDITEKLDYEAELAVIIGQRGRRVPEEKAYDYVAGYTICHDVSARDIQFSDGQWLRGKAFDTFAPLGPCLVTRDEVPDPHNIDIRLDVNGQALQTSNTKYLVFGVPQLIAFVSRCITLEPGDVISTGTPAGVGVFRNPPIFLQPGDTVTITLAGIGTLQNPVVAEK